MFGQKGPEDIFPANKSITLVYKYTALAKQFKRLKYLYCLSC